MNRRQLIKAVALAPLAAIPVAIAAKPKQLTFKGVPVFFDYPSGKSIVESLKYADGQEFRHYSGFDLEITRKDILQAAKTPWKHA